MDFFQLRAGLVQDTGHGGGTGRQSGAAEQQVADLLTAPVGVGLREQEDGAFGQLGQLAASGTAARLIHQAARSLDVERVLPAVESVLGDADQGGEVTGGKLAALPGIEQKQALLGREIGVRRLGWNQPFAGAFAAAETADAPAGGRGVFARGAGRRCGFAGRRGEIALIWLGTRVRGRRR
jgi:hypothetical protein